MADLPLLSEHWEAEFSRFFILPREHSSAVDPALRPLSKGSPYSRGSWLTASSPATILIAKPASHATAILSVSVSGFVHEEHIVSSLRLTWPQIECEPLCPTRGSRVVFVSYNDSSNQLQKFAVRFQSSACAADFISFFKGSSRDTIDVVAPPSDFMYCDSYSPSEMIASHALQYKPCINRFDEGRSYEESADRDESHRLPPLLVKDVNNTTFSRAPPSFTELLTNCSRNHENEIIMQLEDANHIPKSEENAPSQSLLEGVSEQLGLEEDIKNEIARYMSDASFQDMVFRVEKVIHGLAGDLPV